MIRQHLGEPDNGLVGVELGVYEGGTSAALLKALPDLHLIMIDPWREWAPDSSYHRDPKMGKKDNKQWAVHRAEAISAVDPYRERTQIIQATGDEACHMFGRREWLGSYRPDLLDFVFIDANHRYDEAKKDIQDWLPKIKPGGLLCGHDYGGRQQGVKQAVDETFGDRVMTPGMLLWGIKVEPEGWQPTRECNLPDGCDNCRVCGGRCMEAESIERDWHGRGRVIRIFSLCDASDDMEKDDVRTEFGIEEEAVEEWNDMQRSTK